MAPKSKKITSKTDPKTEAGNHPKIDQKWRPNGAQMEPKRHPKINDFLARFSDPSGNIDGTSTELRGNFDGHTFSSRPPRAAPYYQRLLYNNKQRRVAPKIVKRRLLAAGLSKSRQASMGTRVAPKILKRRLLAAESLGKSRHMGGT